MQLYSMSMRARLNMDDTFATLHKDDPFAFWIDRENHPTEAFSVMGAGSGLLTVGTNAFDFLEAQLADQWANMDDIDLPFSWRPGLVGAFAYEAKSETLGLCGQLDAGDSAEIAKFMIIHRALVYDHRGKTVWFIGIFDSAESFRLWHDAALLRIALVGGESFVYRRNNPLPSGNANLVSARHSDDQYLHLIDRAKAHIAAGDAYQLCLTNQLSLETQADPLAIYLHLRKTNPAPLASFMRLGDVSIVSSSPEQFLQIDANGIATTKPIKGTRARHPDAATDGTQDRAIAEELRTNQKERAENLMIVDLMRNDLGKIAKDGQVAVTKLFEVESYATVHQLVSTLEAQLAEGITSLDAVAASFPAGSMTGAPKIRAVEILETLEAGPRGIYSGALGFIAGNGTVDLAMTIRTIVFQNQIATIGIGGGITIDSDPQAELAETKLKAKALLQALNAQLNW
jgi:anthranilate/para-aminobenzoate synthase component I